MSDRNDALEAFNAGDVDPLEQLCTEELATGDPADSFALLNLGVVRSHQGRHAEARDLLWQAAARYPDEAPVQIRLAKQLNLMGLDEEALDVAIGSIERWPHDAGAWAIARHVLAKLGSGTWAERYARRALALRPDDLVGWRALIKGLFLQGKTGETIDACRRAIEAHDTQETFRMSLVFAMLYDEHTRLEALLAVSREFGQHMERRAQPHLRPHRHSPIPGRRLKIGLLSPDLRNHAVMYFAEPLIAGLPRDRFEVISYLTHPNPDAITTRVQLLSDRFRSLSVKDPKQAADVVRDDEVDVLIDLAGHTGHSGLSVMAYRPAPVQATWLGYAATTGLSTIDWRITDHFADPAGSDVFYSEKLVRLPGCFAVYRPHIRNLFQRFDERYDVVPPPALRLGVVTFGSCNNLAKVNEGCIAAWSRILHLVPRSRLLIEGKDMDRDVARTRLREQFSRYGIGDDRLVYVGRDPKRQYLTYHDIDIALDTFPLTGGTTTFDSLWMGVPVVTLLGPSFRERLSGSILASGGFKQDLCDSVDAYVARAVDLASDLPALAKRRAAQRQHMQASTLMDEPAFCRKFGRMLEMLWGHWCAQQSFAGAAPSSASAPVWPERSDEEVRLVPVNGRRVTLRDARSWLEQLRALLRQDRSPSNVESARALALSVLWVCPSDLLAADVARETADWQPLDEGGCAAADAPFPEDDSEEEKG